MSFTYTADPSVPRDRLRLDLGDVRATDVLLEDATLDWCLAHSGSYLLARAKAARFIAQAFNTEVDVSVGGLSEQRRARADAWDKRATAWETLAGQAHAPTAGGLTTADKAAMDADTAAEQPYFKFGQHYLPGTAPTPDDALE